MSSPTGFKDHSLHPMIIPLPIGLWIFSIVSDLILSTTTTVSSNCS
jgi:uncharacterized membrane protein